MVWGKKKKKIKKKKSAMRNLMANPTIYRVYPEPRIGAGTMIQKPTHHIQ